MSYNLNDQVFEEFPVLTTDRLLLRAFEETDARDLFLLRTNEKAIEFMDSIIPKTEEDSFKMIKSIQQSFEEKSALNWVIEDIKTNQMIGYVSFWRMDREHFRAETGYLLHPDYWRKGLMTEALKKIIDFGFKQLKIHSIEANVNTKNLASIRLLEKIGFRKEAHFRENYYFNGGFLDSLIYCMIASDLDSE